MTVTDKRDWLPPRLLDITTLAEHLGVNARHIRRLVAERRIPFIKQAGTQSGRSASQQ